MSFSPVQDEMASSTTARGGADCSSVVEEGVSLQSRARRWCFTVNNYTDVDVSLLQEATAEAGFVKYLVYGKEVGESGTPHLQGYVIFYKQLRFAAVKQIIPRGHLEVARGSVSQAAEYCKKEDKTPFEYGSCPQEAGEAEKCRWDRAKKRALEGDFDEIPGDIYIKHYRTLKEIRKDNMQRPPDLEGVCGVWIYGPPGVGKSYRARSLYPDAYFKMQNKWWDGYQGEENVILDDFDCKELGHHLKIWADRYAFVAETKGGATCIRPKVFVITSNYHPSSDMFGWDPEMENAIIRRFDIIKMDPEGEVRGMTQDMRSLSMDEIDV